MKIIRISQASILAFMIAHTTAGVQIKGSIYKGARPEEILYLTLDQLSRPGKADKLYMPRDKNFFGGHTANPGDMIRMEIEDYASRSNKGLMNLIDFQVQVYDDFCFELTRERIEVIALPETPPQS